MSTPSMQSIRETLASRARRMVKGLLPAHVRFERAGRSFLVDGEHEVHELPRLVERGTVAIDVGALIGDYCYWLCKHVGPEGRVIAIEPQPEYARMLRKASARLKLPVTVHECALSSSSGFADLWIPLADGRKMSGFATLARAPSAARRARVELRRLDEITAGVQSRVSFIKIDVEGHELEVLKGAAETLRRHRPNLLIEIEQRHSPVPIEHTFEFIRDQGYSGYCLIGGVRTPLENVDLARNRELAQGKGPFEAIDPGYVFNYVFVPSGKTEGAFELDRD